MMWPVMDPIFVRFWARLEWNGSRLLRSKHSNNFFFIQRHIVSLSLGILTLSPPLPTSPFLESVFLKVVEMAKSDEAKHGT